MKFNIPISSQSRETCRRLNAAMRFVRSRNNKKGLLKTKKISKSTHSTLMNKKEDELA